MIQIPCAIPGCGWQNDYSQSPGDQYRTLKTHFREAHNLPPQHGRKAAMTETLTREGKIVGSDGIVAHPTPGSPSVEANLWAALVGYIEKAMTWPPRAQDDPWAASVDAYRIAELEDDLAKAKVTAAGRGVAEAIVIIYTPKWESADDVIREAVRRYKEGQAVVDPTPAPSAPENSPTPSPAPAPVIASADTTIPAPASLPTPPPVAASSAAVPVPTPTAPAGIPAPASSEPVPSLGSAPVTVADLPIVEPAPVPVSGLAQYTPEELDRIRDAKEAFDAATVAGMFKVSVAEIEAL